MPRIALIAALSENRVIGRAGDLPWHLPEDLKRFKRLTMDHTVIMGRKTFDSVGRALPGRNTIVVTRDQTFAAEDVTVVHDLESALAEATRAVGGRDDEVVFILGGGEIYRLAMDRADILELTIVHADVEGDTFFPEYDPGMWRLVHDEHHEHDERHAYDFSFRRYERLRQPARSNG